MDDFKRLKFEEKEGAHLLAYGDRPILHIEPVDGTRDEFEELEPGVFRWTRISDTPVSEMRMAFSTATEATYTMVPALNYNGNAWGNSVEYTGDSFEGTPWTYAYHRTTIPACTYSESGGFACALMADKGEEPSCSIYKAEGAPALQKHVLVWPEQEGPKVLWRHMWAKDTFMGTMEPKRRFCAIITAYRLVGERFRYKNLLDFAWRYYGHTMQPHHSTDQLWKYSIAYFKALWTKERDGFAAFNRGFQWYDKTCEFSKRNQVKYELGWVGQSASASVTLLHNYLKTGDRDSYDKAVSCLDSWIKYAKTDSNSVLPRVKFDGAPCDQARAFPIDACNLGQGAQQYFEAADLMEKCGTPREDYLKFAMDICDFAVKVQKEDGQIGKSWNEAGEVIQAKGTIGAFFIEPLLEAYHRTGDNRYFDTAVRAFDYYSSELTENGFTTAGALDTYCIDKESSSPLLHAAIALYEETKKPYYVEKAEEAAWYISTWMMHYTIPYPADSLLGQIKFDSLGMTGVSTAHNAIDQYAIRDVPAFLRLADITGRTQWRERGLALWYGASQLISDGTLCISGRVRPAGSQDEGVLHTRWGRPGLDPFNPNQWLTMWPIAFRMEILRRKRYLDELNAGLNNIKDKI